MTNNELGRMLRRLAFGGAIVLVPTLAFSQRELAEAFLQDSVAVGEGWKGFADFPFLLNAFFTLTLATVLGAVLAYHPKHRQLADTPEEIEAPKVYILYAVIGALIGIMVVKYGLVVGFVLFGIGGLIRFRTVLRSASLTGHVIFMTLIGLSCGLNLPNVAVLASVFAYILLYILDSYVTYRVDVRALPSEHFVAAATEYRRVLEAEGCRVLSEKKDPGKRRVTFIFRAGGNQERGYLEQLLESKVDPSFKGAVNWEVD
jgi:hypothetical protein